MKGLQRLLITALLGLSCGAQALEKPSYQLILDADFSGTKASSVSIERGIRTALAEHNNSAGGYQFELVLRNHHGSTPRSKKNLKQVLKNPQALAVFSGLHSPPLLANRSFINNNQILLLDPWAAASPITRGTDKENWIFRLSVDDAKAGYVIANSAAKEGFNKPYLLLEKTGWGKANNRTMVKALNELGVEPVGIAWFNWGIGIHDAKIKLRNIKNSGADVIFVVANAAEGKTFADAILALEPEVRLPVRSHWGITGGDFVNHIDSFLKAPQQLQFIQTKFSFLSKAQSPLAVEVLKRAQGLFSDIKGPSDIKAQTGFVHAYDLTKILISAVNQTGLTGEVTADRRAIHQALENLKDPVEGLIKTYQQPFSPVTSVNPDGHEALSQPDYLMGYYGLNNDVILIK